MNILVIGGIFDIGTEEIAKIVTGLRRFVRLDETEWQFTDINEEIDNVIALMGSEFLNRIRITRDYGDIPQIHCSPSSLNQVFMSIFTNASEAIEGEGEISIRTSTQREHVIVEISDTGKGIPAADIDRIFEPGFTTKGAGVGVGAGVGAASTLGAMGWIGMTDSSSTHPEKVTISKLNTSIKTKAIFHFMVLTFF